MHEWKGKPLIGHLLDRVGKCKSLHITAVLFSENDVGSILDDYLRKRDQLVLIGPEEDVAERFRGALDIFPCDGFVRLCADSPLIEHQLIDGLVKIWEKHPSHYLDLHTPAGHIEILDRSCWLKWVPLFNGDEREHVTSFFNRPGRPVIDWPSHLDRLDYWEDIRQ